MRYFFVLAVIASMTVADMHQKDGEAEAEYNSMSKFVMGFILAFHFNHYYIAYYNGTGIIKPITLPGAIYEPAVL